MLNPQQTINSAPSFSREHRKPSLFFPFNSKLPRQPRWPKQQVAQTTKMAKTARCPDNQDGQNSKMPRQPRWPKQKEAKATKMAKTGGCPDNQAAQNRRLPRQPSCPKQQDAQSTKLPKTERCSTPLVAFPFQLHLSRVCTNRAVSHQCGVEGAQFCHSGDGVQALQQTGHIVQRLSAPTNHCVTGEGRGQKALIDERFEPHDGRVVYKNEAVEFRRKEKNCCYSSKVCREKQKQNKK